MPCARPRLGALMESSLAMIDRTRPPGGQSIVQGLGFASGRNWVMSRPVVSVSVGVTCTPAACSAVATQTLQVLNRWNGSPDA